MKKIGILNFHYSEENYGAVLQAVALEHVIKSLGHNAEHIDFIPDSLSIPIKIKFRLGEMLRSIGILKKRPQRIGCTEIFENFRDDWLSRSVTYRNSRDLKKASDKYTSIVVGSDQVWRPVYTHPFTLMYFLSFVGKNTRRIAYAASFGVDYWQKNDLRLTNAIKNELQKFHSISVREDAGVSLCKDIFDCSATQVLDPTLLRGRELFDEVIEKEELIQQKPNIVFYKLDVDSVFYEELNNLGKMLECDVENIYHNEINGGKAYNTVPYWLCKIRDSRLVITDSFHCVCFAILFEKEFFYSVNKGRGVSRLVSLLGMLGLNERICYNSNELSKKFQMTEKIDYSIVNKKLAKQRDISLAFLIQSLKE